MKKAEQKNPLSKRAGALEAFVESEPTVEESKPRRVASSPTNEIRATFIVDSEKLQLLKDYAYIERKQIKEVVDQMLTEFLNAHFDNEHAINGNTWEK